MSETVYGVWAVRSGNSIFGHAEAWCKDHGNERGSVKYPIERTPDDKVPAVGRPAHLPENYLLNAELKEEAQTGNYNMLDGRMDNISPQSAAEKSSVIDKLKSEQPDQEQKQPSRGDKKREREI